MILLKLTEEESDMIYDALRNHMDYLDCSPFDEVMQNTLDSLFDKLHDAESVE